MGPSTQAERWDLACCLRRVPSVSACAMLPLSWLNLPPHPITVYASHPPSPTTTQHSLSGGALPPYRSRSFTGRTASASPDAPAPEVRIHLPPAASQERTPPSRDRVRCRGCGARARVVVSVKCGKAARVNDL